MNVKTIKIKALCIRVVRESNLLYSKAKITIILRSCKISERISERWMVMSMTEKPRLSDFEER